MLKILSKKKTPDGRKIVLREVGVKFSINSFIPNNMARNLKSLTQNKENLSKIK